MKLKKEIKLKNETDNFIKIFYGKKPYQNLKSVNGNIVSCETKDTEIKDYLKKLGLK